MDMKKDNGRLGTRLTRQIMIEITSLEPACDFRGEYTTVVVNAQGCGVVPVCGLDQPLRRAAVSPVEDIRVC